MNKLFENFSNVVSEVVGSVKSFFSKTPFEGVSSTEFRASENGRVLRELKDLNKTLGNAGQEMKWEERIKKESRGWQA